MRNILWKTKRKEATEEISQTTSFIRREPFLEKQRKKSTELISQTTLALLILSVWFCFSGSPKLAGSDKGLHSFEELTKTYALKSVLHEFLTGLVGKVLYRSKFNPRIVHNTAVHIQFHEISSKGWSDSPYTSLRSI